MSFNRRVLLCDGALVTGATLLPLGSLRAQAPRYAVDPFSLGVASGFPTATTLVIWTRLAPEPLQAGGGMPPVRAPVQWQLATDERFARVVARGEIGAVPELAHSVRVEVEGLNADRDYWYRFRSGDAESEIGRGRTAPAMATANTSLNMGLASCQHYENAHYAAYSAMADAGLDLIVHVGDYIYENAGVSRVRRHALKEAETLTEYRQRYALYKLDASLKRAHASAPWLVTWDDHEVDDDYAGSLGVDEPDSERFLERRAAAYQAFYEHLPLPPRLQPRGSALALFSRHPYGRLANLYLLDGRQYRSPQACGLDLVEPCPDLARRERTMLGPEQERWLARSVAEEQARWTILAQQTVFAAMDQRPGPGIGYWSDGWSGYPAARQRFVDTLADSAVRNAVILGGDLHAWLVNDVHRRPGDASSPVVATEVVGTSISSAGPTQNRLDTWTAENPNVRFADGGHRGYTRLNITPDRVDIDLVAVDNPAEPDSGTSRLATWHVLDGAPGAVA